MIDQDYIINVGSNGTFTATGNYQTTQADIEHIIKNLESQKAKEITLYFHGGLVSEKTGLETARKLYPALKTIDNFPIFLVWETGLIETLKDNIEKVGETNIFKTLLKLVIKVIEKRLGISLLNGRGESSMINDAVIEAELQKERPFENLDQEEHISSRGFGTVDELPEQEYLLEAMIEEDFRILLKEDPEAQEILIHPDGTSARSLFTISTVAIALGKVGLRVVKRFIKKRHHGFYPTIVEEIFRQIYLTEVGALIWKGMKTKASQMWHNNTGLSGSHQYAARFLLDRLVEYISQSADANGKSTVKINLVGHSAGSIVICELLKEAAKAHPSLIFNQIILLAPACRTDLFVSEVINHPERYTDLRCFTMSDENECSDILVPYLYTRSLLYLISGVLEEGEGYDEYILGMERYLSGNSPYHDIENLKSVRKYFSSEDKRLVLSKSAENAKFGFRSSSLKHGNFDDDDLTIASIKHILNN